MKSIQLNLNFLKFASLNLSCLIRFIVTGAQTQFVTTHSYFELLNLCTWLVLCDNHLDEYCYGKDEAKSCQARKSGKTLRVFFILIKPICTCWFLLRAFGEILVNLIELPRSIFRVKHLRVIIINTRVDMTVRLSIHSAKILWN